MESVEDLARELRLRAHAQRIIPDGFDRDEWCRLVQEAARVLERPLLVVRGVGLVVALLRDWPANELELQLDEARIANTRS